VQWVSARLAADGTRLLSTYRAPDAESVRLALHQQGLGAAPVWAADVFDATAPGDDQTDGYCVVAEVSLDRTLQPQPVEQARATVEAALRTKHLFLPQAIAVAKDNRLICIIEAEDAAATNECLRATGLAVQGVWPARTVTPVPPPVFEGLQPAYAGVAGVDDATIAASGRSAAVEVAQTVFDAVVIGAGAAGLYALYKLRDMGLSVKVYERAPDVGGTWYWNKYPGARMDSEAYTYAYSFSDELVQDWQWSEVFSDQPETLRYLQHVADRFDLRGHIQFHTTVRAASFNEQTQCWRIETDSGEVVTARYLIAAPGTLSIPRFPDYPGMEEFAGESYHTATWPAAGVELRGKRVGVFGTGATGVQVIQTIASEVAHLTVFQRSPTYCLPQRNALLDDGERARIRREWPRILESCRASYGGFIHDFIPRSGLSFSAEEREARFAELWQTPGHAFWLGNYADLVMDQQVNDHASDFVRRKIRERVSDPQVARKLIPDHPFGTRRVPLENGYYEVYNRDNAELVDLRESPIERLTASGVQTSRGAYSLDVIVYATGFDAVTGGFTTVDIRGRGGQSIAGKWEQGATTALGLQVHGFPNLFLVSGPQNAASLCNAVRCIETNVDWIARCIQFLRRKQLSCIEPTAVLERQWTEHVNQAVEASLLREHTDSWFFRAVKAGEPKRVAIYVAGGRAYREHIEAIERAGYPGFVMT